MASGFSIKSAGKFYPVMSGIREVLNSSGVQSMLMSQTNKAAANCNAMMQSQLKHAGGEYVASTKFIKNVNCGLVSVGGAQNGKFAKIDNYRQNTLKKGCGA